MLKRSINKINEKVTEDLYDSTKKIIKVGGTKILKISKDILNYPTNKYNEQNHKKFFQNFCNEINNSISDFLHRKMRSDCYENGTDLYIQPDNVLIKRWFNEFLNSIENFDIYYLGENDINSKMYIVFCKHTEDFIYKNMQNYEKLTNNTWKYKLKNNQ